MCPLVPLLFAFSLLYLKLKQMAHMLAEGINFS